MARKHKCPECPAGEKWAVPYADFLSLLLALFIALYAISATNTAKVEALKKEFVKIFDFPSSAAVKTDKQMDEKNKGVGQQSKDAKQSAEEVDSPHKIDKIRALLDQRENNIFMDLPAFISFKSGESEIANSDDEMFLKRVAMIIENLEEGVKLEVRGFCDGKDSYLNNFKLAGERAFNVAAFLMHSGVAPEVLSYKSYGANEPKGANANAPENNRVELYFSVDIKDARLQKSILDVMGKEFAQ